MKIIRVSMEFATVGSIGLELREIGEGSDRTDLPVLIDTLDIDPQTHTRSRYKDMLSDNIRKNQQN